MSDFHTQLIPLLFKHPNLFTNLIQFLPQLFAIQILLMCLLSQLNNLLILLLNSLIKIILHSKAYFINNTFPSVIITIPSMPWHYHSHISNYLLSPPCCSFLYLSPIFPISPVPSTGPDYSAIHKSWLNILFAMFPFPISFVPQLIIMPTWLNPMTNISTHPTIVCVWVWLI